MNETKSKGKKIDIVVKYFYPVAAGIEVNIMETYKVLVNNGWDVTVHTSDYDYTTRTKLNPSDNVNGIKIKRYKLKTPSYMPQLPYTDTNLICLHNFDILPNAFILAKVLLDKLTGKKTYKVFLTPHGGFNPEWRVFSKLEAVIKYLYSYTLGVFLINRAVDGIRAVSDWEKQEMIKKGLSKNKIVVISNGIEDMAFENIDDKVAHEFKNKIDGYGRYILQIGRIYPIKNYETTIKAMPHIPSDINYLIVGPDADLKYRNSLIDLAKALGVKHRLHFLGVQRFVEKYYIIKNAIAMVHMAIWESFCNVIHEGISQGIPIIAADNTALSFLVKNGENGFLVETQDHMAVADKINYLLDPNNADVLEKIRKNNMAKAKNNTWKATAEKMDQTYTNLIESSK